jgi:hypothetical protein
MGWTDWFKDLSGDFIKEKKSTRGNRLTTEWLRSTGGSKKDHQHIAVHRNSNGRTKSANGVPKKSKR